ncbi:MAG: hypothetical protein QNJ32_07150 [Xenococcaceae cyanobacterium MO_167.B27]|nr:hypothetical protein [Xenococcaceae cyanobacterium MO_167.B27]
MELALQSLTHHWIEQHPRILWLLQHPVTTLVGILISIILFSRLLAAIAYLIDRIWLWIIKAPWLLVKSLLGIKNQTSEAVGQTINYELAVNPEQLTKIVNQLEKIEKQQQQILQDVAILKQQSQTINTQKSVASLPEEKS